MPLRFRGVPARAHRRERLPVRPPVALCRCPFRGLRSLSEAPPNSLRLGGNTLSTSLSSQHTSTAVLIDNGRGEYLLHLRDAHKPICDPGTWSLVGGGGTQPGETLDEAIAREILEETGLLLCDITPYTSAKAHGPNVTEGNIQVYTARWDGVAHDLPVTEGIMFAWFDVATMEQLSMCPWAHEVIRTHHAEHPAPPLSGPRDDAGQDGAGAVKNVIGAHLLLERDGRTLLGLRHPGVKFAGGEWHALAGQVERESVRACLVREAYEEAGIVIKPAALTLVHTVHLLDDHENAEPRIQPVLPGKPVVRRAGGPRARYVHGLAVVAAGRPAGPDGPLHPCRDRRHPRRHRVHRARLGARSACHRRQVNRGESRIRHGRLSGRRPARQRNIGASGAGRTPASRWGVDRSTPAGRTVAPGPRRADATGVRTA